MSNQGRRISEAVALCTEYEWCEGIFRVHMNETERERHMAVHTAYEMIRESLMLYSNERCELHQTFQVPLSPFSRLLDEAE